MEKRRKRPVKCFDRAFRQIEFVLRIAHTEGLGIDSLCFQPQCLLLSYCLHLAVSLCPYNRPRSQWPRGLRSGLRPLACWERGVRIPPRAWMFVSFECCVLSGTGLCVGLITRPEEPCPVIAKPLQRRR